MTDTQTAAPVIQPTALYTLDAAAEVLRTNRRGVERAIKLHGLKFSKRLGRVWILGAWILEWIEAAGRVRQPQ